MSDTSGETPADYHLLLDPAEIPVAARAVRLLIADEAHEPDIRRLAREVLEGLEGETDAAGRLTLGLTARQMKIAHSAVRLLMNDLQREQAQEREILRGILGKLPDEHVMRAIEL